VKNSFLKPVSHGGDHRPGGSDPTYAGVWHNVGDTDEPAFQNSWDNVGDPFAPMRFRLVVGPPSDSGSSIDDRQSVLEIQGSVIGGDTGTVIFTLPDGYRPSHELRLPASDSDGTFVVLRVEANGDVSHGLT